MNLTRINEYWHLLEAAKAGKTIQWQFGGDGKWRDLTESDLLDTPEHYRVKPEPKLRPWRPEEIPVGALIRRKEKDSFLAIITARYQALFWTTYHGTGGLPTEQVLKSHEHSTDGGVTWKPCGVEEAP
jgi:hypothetical protein